MYIQYLYYCTFLNVSTESSGPVSRFVTRDIKNDVFKIDGFTFFFFDFSLISKTTRRRVPNHSANLCSPPSRSWSGHHKARPLAASTYRHHERALVASWQGRGSECEAFESQPIMAEEDDMSAAPQPGREDDDVETAAAESGGRLLEDRPGPGDESVPRDVLDNSSAAPRPASEETGLERRASASSRDDGGASSAGGGGVDVGAAAPRAAPPGSAVSQGSSSRNKRDRKKKGRGGGVYDGEPAMSVEDLFVTISTVQVCTAATTVVWVLCTIMAAGAC